MHRIIALVTFVYRNLFERMSAYLWSAHQFNWADVKNGVNYLILAQLANDFTCGFDNHLFLSERV